VKPATMLAYLQRGCVEILTQSINLNKSYKEINLKKGNPGSPSDRRLMSNSELSGLDIF